MAKRHDIHRVVLVQYYSRKSHTTAFLLLTEHETHLERCSVSSPNNSIGDLGLVLYELSYRGLTSDTRRRMEDKLILMR
jgi:hypothetical protein